MSDKPKFIDGWKCPECGNDTTIEVEDEKNHCDHETLYMGCPCGCEWKINRNIEITAHSIEYKGEEYEI